MRLQIMLIKLNLRGMIMLNQRKETTPRQKMVLR